MSCESFSKAARDSLTLVRNSKFWWKIFVTDGFELRENLV